METKYKSDAEMNELTKKIDASMARWKKARAVFDSQDIMALSYVAYHLERRGLCRATMSEGVIELQDDLGKFFPRFNSPALAAKVQAYPDFETLLDSAQTVYRDVEPDEPHWWDMRSGGPRLTGEWGG